MCSVIISLFLCKIKQNYNQNKNDRNLVLDELVTKRLYILYIVTHVKNPFLLIGQSQNCFIKLEFICQKTGNLYI